MKIKGDYLIIEINDNCEPLVKVQNGDAYGTQIRDRVHWTEYDKYSAGATFHGKAMYLFRRPINMCTPELLALVGLRPGLEMHFI